MRRFLATTLLIWGYVVKIAVNPAQRLAEETIKQGGRVINLGFMVITFTVRTANEKVVQPVVTLVKEEREMLKTREQKTAVILNFAFFFGADYGMKLLLHPEWPAKLIFTLLAFLVGYTAEWVFWRAKRLEERSFCQYLRDQVVAGITFTVVFSVLETTLPIVWLYKLYSFIAYICSRLVQKKLEERRQKTSEES